MSFAWRIVLSWLWRSRRSSGGRDLPPRVRGPTGVPPLLLDQLLHLVDFDPPHVCRLALFLVFQGEQFIRT